MGIPISQKTKEIELKKIKTLEFYRRPKRPSLYDLILTMNTQELKSLLDFVSSMVKQDETQNPITE